MWSVYRFIFCKSSKIAFFVAYPYMLHSMFNFRNYIESHQQSRHNKNALKIYGIFINYNQIV